MSRYRHFRASSAKEPGRLRIGPSRFSAFVLLGALSTAIAAFGIPVTGAASASVVARAAVPNTSVFCGYANSEAKSSSASVASLTPASLQKTYSKLKSEESFVLANSPKQLKGDFQLLFGYLNKLIGVLASAKYNFAKLTPAQLKSFSSLDTKQFQAATKSIETYLTKVCGLKPVS